MSLESNIELLTGAIVRLAAVLEGARVAVPPAPVKEVLPPPAGETRAEPAPEAPRRTRKPKPEAVAAEPEPEQHKLGTGAPTILESDVRALLMSVTRKTGNSDAALAILAKFGGSKRISEVDEAKWPLVIDAATEILEAGEAA